MSNLCVASNHRKRVEKKPYVGGKIKRCYISENKYFEFLSNISAQKFHSMRNVSTLSYSHLDLSNILSISEPILSPSKPTCSRPVTVRSPRIENFAEEFVLPLKDVQQMIDGAPQITDIVSSNINEVLPFKKKQGLESLANSMVETCSIRNHYLSKGDLLEAAMLSVCVVRHRVLLMEEGIDNAQQKSNAWQSFPKDVAGKWNQPTGDLLLFPGLHTDIKYLLDALSELYSSMQIVKLLPGSLISDQAKKLTVNSDTIGDHLKRNEFKYKIYLENLEYFNLTYKPIFTKIYFKMKTAKARLAVELFQCAFLIFSKMADWAFGEFDIGTALFFTQMMQKSAECLVELLPLDESLKTSYIFVMCHYLVARCYSSTVLYFNVLERFRPNYGKLHREMEVFKRDFFIYIKKRPRIDKKFPYDLPVEFTETFPELLMTSSTAFLLISFPLEWKRSLYEQETMFTLVFIIGHRCQPVDMIPSEKPSIEGTIVNLQDLARAVDDIANKSTASARFKIFAQSLSAKNARFLLCMEECLQRELSNSKTNCMKKRIPNAMSLNRIRCLQRSALSLMNENCCSTSSSFQLALLCKTAAKTMDDEVVYILHQMESGMFNTEDLFHLLGLLPEVVDIWFRPDRRRNAGTGKIPSDDLPHFNHIISMFFFGLAMSYHIMHSKHQSPQLRANQEYCFSVTAALLRREGATERVLAAFLDHIQLLEKSLLGSFEPPVKYRDTRVRVLLKRLTWALPILHEYLVEHDIAGAFPSGYRRRVIRGSSLLERTPIENIPYMSEYSKSIFEKVIRYIENEIGFKHSEDWEILHGKGKFGEFECEPALLLSQSAHEYPEKLSDTFTPKPPLELENLNVDHGYPIESYYDEEEAEFNDRISTPYDNDIYTIILHDSPNLPENTTELNNNVKMKTVLGGLKDALLRLLEAEIIALIDLTDEDGVHIISDEVDKFEEPINRDKTQDFQEYKSSSYWLSLFKLVQFNLQRNLKEDLPLLVITRVLYKLDCLLNKVKLSNLLRAHIES